MKVKCAITISLVNAKIKMEELKDKYKIECSAWTHSPAKDGVSSVFGELFIDARLVDFEDLLKALSNEILELGDKGEVAIVPTDIYAFTFIKS